MISAPSRVFGLDVLRAAAILGVLVAHTATFFPNRSPRLEASLLYAGYIGVEMFFVLSGFLIGRIVLRGLQADQSWKGLREFWIRRWFRTLPNYFLFLIVNILLAMAISQPLPSLWHYVVFIQHSVVNQEFYSESWTLAVEEWFYILFPLLAWLFARCASGMSLSRRHPGLLFFFSVGLFLCSAMALRSILVAELNPRWDSEVRRTLLYRLDAPGYGVLGAGMSVYFSSFWKRYRSIMSAIGMTLFLISVGYFFSSDERLLNNSYFARTFFFTLTSCAVLCFLPVLHDWKQSTAPSAGLITAISLWSYSLYLAQLPVRECLVRWGGGTDDSSASSWILVVVFFCASTAIAALCYRFFEKPATDLRERVMFNSNSVR